MGILQPVVPSTAFAKMAIHGPQGCGKTWTAVEIMLGLSRKYHAGAPVAFVDTEKGSDHLAPRFKHAKVELLGVKTRAFADLLDAFADAETRGCCGIIVDSATHFWDELRAAYSAKLNRTYGLKISDWGPIKEQWAAFPRALLNSNLHVVVCGRAGNVFEDEVDEKTGKTEIRKVGTKFRAEGEFGYEPDLALEMHLEQSSKKGSVEWDHVCTVLKDRTIYIDEQTGECRSRLNGQVCIDPKFEYFQPFFDALQIGQVKHVGVGTGTSDRLIPDPDRSGYQLQNERAVLLDKIKVEFTRRGIGGTSKEEKQLFVNVLHDAFGTYSWAEVETKWPRDIAPGLLRLQEIMAGMDECSAGRHLWVDLPNGTERGCSRARCSARSIRQQAPPAPREPGEDVPEGGDQKALLPGDPAPARTARPGRRAGAAKAT